MKKMIMTLGASSIILASCVQVDNPEVIPSNIRGNDLNREVVENVNTGKNEQAFLGTGLLTNTSISSIDQNLVLGGGPAKDGIPAINDPKFLSIEEAKESLSFLGEKDNGIAVTIDGESRYYPYGILVWHEIVNDEIAGEKIAVTFCPLCGSAIVFDRSTDDGELQFGVSGKLYESNMLMYDTTTESLWSQSLGEAVVGDKTGQKLKVLDAQLMTFGDFESNFPNGKVLSDDTGHARNYGFIPYGNYDDTEDLYFSVQNEDASFRKKEIFYIVPVADTTIAFHLADLREAGKVEYEYGDDLIELEYNDGIITTLQGGKELPGYYEMWFSWRTHNTENENVWSL